jgi:hypothetical protein
VRFEQVAVIEAPDDEIVAKLAMIVAGRGNAITETLRARSPWTRCVACRGNLLLLRRLEMPFGLSVEIRGQPATRLDELGVAASAKRGTITETTG